MAKLDTNDITFENENSGLATIKKRNGKRTHWTPEAFKNALKDVNPNIILLSDYVSMKTKIKCRCDRCDLEWECIPDLILNRGRGCTRCDGKYKIARDGFIKKLSEVHPTLHLCGDYVDSATPVWCGCDVCGYEFEIKLAGLWKSPGCPKCTGTYKRTREDLIAELEIKNPTVRLVGEYINTQVSTEWECKKCSTRFWNRPSKVLLGQSCPECKKRKIGDALRKPHEVFLKEMEERMPYVELLGCYEGWNKKIKCRCKKCGGVFYGLPGNMRKGEGCPPCGLKKLAEINRKTHEQFVSEMAIVNDRIKIVGKYEGDATRIECECLNCERRFLSWPSNLLKGHGCRHCTRNQTSFMERTILMAFEQTLGKDDVVARDREQIGEELDIYIKSLNAAIEPGGWVWHCNRMTKDAERYNLCKQKGIRLIIIFDGFSGDRSSLEFDNDDLWTYPINLGDRNNRTELIGCIKRIFKELGLNYNFSEDEEEALLTEAKLSVSRRKTSDVIDELASINENIELLSKYEDGKTKMKCKCKICNNIWEVDYEHLIRRKHGCPKCHSPNKQVVNLDTGEMFDSATDAAKHLGLTPSAIGIACRNGTRCNKNHWAYIANLTPSQLADLRAKFPDTFTL